MNRTKRTRGSGVTMVEVLMALLVATVTLPVVLQGVSLAIKAGRTAIDRRLAYSLARSKLEEATLEATLGLAPTPSGDFAPDWPDFRFNVTSILRDDSLEELTVFIVKEGIDERPLAHVTTLVVRRSAS